MTDIEIKTRSIYDELSPAEQKVAWYFLQNLGSVFDDPIAVLAEKSGVSQVMWEAGSLEAIRSTAQIQDASVIEEVAAKIAAADTVRLFGVGASGLVANDLYYKLLRVDVNAVFCTDLHVQLTYITAAKPSDVAILFSNSGNTTEILELARAARERGACVVAVTKYGANQLSELADFVLPTSSPELQFRSGATSSRLAALFVVDVLFTTLCNKNYSTVAKPLAESYSQCSKHHA